MIEKKKVVSFKKRKMPFVQHDCSLSVYERKRIVNPHATGTQKVRYCVVEFLLPWRKHYKTKLYLRSHYAIEQERRRHLKNKYSYIMHPLSKLNFIRQFVVLYTWILSLFLDPFVATFVLTKTDPKYMFLKYIRYIADYLGLIQCFVRFFVGFIHPRTSEVILDHPTIIMTYLKSYFIIDVIGALPFYHMHHNSILDTENYLDVFLNSLWIFKIFRLKTIKDEGIAYLNNKGIKSQYITLIIIGFIMLYIMHMMTCVIYLVSTELIPHGRFAEYFIKQQKLSYNAKYISAFYVMTVMFCGTIWAKLTPDPYEELFNSFILLSGVLSKTVILAILLTTVAKLNRSESKFDAVMVQLTRYADRNHLPGYLKYRLLHFYERTYEKRFFAEEDILATLPKQIRQEIHFYECMQTLGKNPFLRNLPLNCIVEIFKHSKRELFLVNDIIINLGDQPHMIYFLIRGVVAMILPGGLEYNKHYTDGDTFGAVLYYSGGISSSMIVAEEVSEVLCLPGEAYERICKLYPEYKMLSLKWASEKSRHFQRFIGEVKAEAEEVMVEYTAALENKEERN